ncbi:MAG: replication protein [Pseudodesulfovibrio sp.]|uniref:replication protein n=1 Tax=Pseudodesulfovibrio sp. TaxID=2035812 RepID=UPI003D11787C
MSSPQLEDGYLKIANSIVEALARFRLPGQEGQIVWAVFRRTYGYNKKSDDIAYSQLAEDTGIPRKKVAALVKSLAEKKVLFAVPNMGDRAPLNIGLNKDFSQWVSVPQKGDIPQKGDSLSPKKGTSLSPKKGTTKDIRKDILKNNRQLFEFADAFQRFALKRFPKGAPKVTDKLLEEAVDVVDKLIRLDGFTLDEIKDAMRWAVKDEFWSKNARSLAKLRQPSKTNGLTKFQNIREAFLEAQGHPRQAPQGDSGAEVAWNTVLAALRVGPETAKAADEKAHVVVMYRLGGYERVGAANKWDLKAIKDEFVKHYNGIRQDKEAA